MDQHELELRRLERRRAPRFRYHATVEIEWGSARLRARTRDVSEGRRHRGPASRRRIPRPPGHGKSGVAGLFRPPCRARHRDGCNG